MLDISVTGGCQSCGRKFAGGWATCPRCIEDSEAEDRKVPKCGQEAVIAEMLVDLGIKEQAAAEAAELAQARIKAGTPPVLAMIQAMVGETQELRNGLNTRSGLSFAGDKLARRIWDLVSWPTAEFDSLSKAGPT